MPLDTVLTYFDAANYPPAYNTYMVTAATGSVFGQGTKMFQLFRLDPSTTNTTVKLTNASTQLAYSVKLQSLWPLRIPDGQPALTLDWSQLRTNAFGDAFDPTAISEVMVGHYLQYVPDLEKRFLDLELIADELYRTEIAVGTSVDLSVSRNAAGKAFAGIDGNGTWLVALRCGSCRNPAPWYLSILQPCGIVP
jgi:hypothetical protein